MADIERQLSFFLDDVPSPRKLERRERAVNARPEYVPSVEAAVDVLRGEIKSRGRLDIPQRRRISGALLTIASERIVNPEDVIVPPVRPLLSRYLNFPKPMREEPIEWPSQEHLARELSLIGGVSGIKPTIIWNLVRVVRGAVIDDALERLVLPGSFHWPLVKRGVIRAHQILEPTPETTTEIWRTCFARPRYEQLKERLRHFAPTWGPQILELPIFPQELTQERTSELIEQQPADADGELVQRLAKESMENLSSLYNWHNRVIAQSVLGLREE